MTSSLVSSLAFAQTVVVQYIESTLFALGTVGSILNIVLFSQRKLRVNSCCTYFSASSAAALVSIWMGIIPQLYALNHSPDPIFNRNFCKARSYLLQSSTMLCRWLLTIACIDRCFLSSTKARLRLFSTVRIAKKAILVLCIIWLIFPVHMLVFIDVRRIGYITCMFSTDGSAVYHSVYTILAGGLSPPVVMLICTRMIWKSLRLKRQRQEMIQPHRRTSKRETRDAQVLAMLLFQVLIFILSTLPYMSFNLYLASTRSVMNKSNDRLAIEAFVQLFTEVAVFVHPAVSFYSNTMVSQTFRRELITLFWRIVTCGRGQRFLNRQRVGPSTIVATIHRRNDLPVVVIN